MAAPRARAEHEPVVPTTFSLPPAYREAMDTQAAKLGIGRSELLRRVIERFKWVEPPPPPEPLTVPPKGAP